MQRQADPLLEHGWPLLLRLPLESHLRPAESNGRNGPRQHVAKSVASRGSDRPLTYHGGDGRGVPLHPEDVGARLGAEVGEPAEGVKRAHALGLHCLAEDGHAAAHLVDEADDQQAVLELHCLRGFHASCQSNSWHVSH